MTLQEAEQGANHGMGDYYWHFAATDAAGVPRCRYEDGREIRVGETLTVDCEPILCEQGLHASTRIIDALRYAAGSCICKVQLGGVVEHGRDKSVGTERTVVSMLSARDGERILLEFARWCALQVIELWDAPDVVREYLETAEQEIQDAAQAAAWHAARAAARAAAAAAAGAAAWDAAHAAARASAHAAAWDAAWEGNAWDCAWVAAWEAEWEAAYSEARNTQNAKLTELVEQALSEQGANHG